MAAALDTLKLAQAFRDKAKFTPEQAEGAANAIAEAVQTDLSTKADLTEAMIPLRLELHKEATSIRGEVRETEMRLRMEIANAKAEQIKWMLGTFGFQAAAVIGAVFALIHRIKEGIK